MNWSGCIIGLVSFLIIGIYHPLVIKGEYHFGVKIWWLFALFGTILLICSLLYSNIVVSAILGVASFSSYWGILELFHQRERVRKGWFPKKPKPEVKMNKNKEAQKNRK